MEGESLSLPSLKDNYIEWLIFRLTSSSSAWKQLATRGERRDQRGGKGWREETCGLKKKQASKLRWRVWWKKRRTCDWDSRSVCECVCVCVCWHQLGHEATWVQVRATQHHFSHQQSQTGCEESCSSPIWLNTHTHTGSRKHLQYKQPFWAQTGGKIGHLLIGNVVNSPVTNRHAIIFISSR